MEMAAGAAAVMAAGPLFRTPLAAQEVAVQKPELPFAENALEPHISARTLSFHYGKHHMAYYNKTVELSKKYGHEGESVERLMEIAKKENLQDLYNNSAQLWNHSFFWQCLKPGGAKEPQGELRRKIEQAFGSVQACKDELVKVSVGRFASGWGWLVLDGGAVKAVNTMNAENPMPGAKPLLTVDVWEHAYYLDYQNKRDEFVKNVVENLLNWDFASQNMS